MNIDYIMNNLYEILENRIDSNDDRNSFNMKLFQIDRNEFDDIRIRIFEEYSIIELLIMIDKDFLNILILDNEESEEENLIYNILYSINLEIYSEFNFKRLKNLIIHMINDYLEIHYQIKI